MQPAQHRPVRILLCKSGLEEHDRGVRYLARRLMAEGMEVVYIVFHDPAEAARVAIEEDVQVIGLSSSAGGHLSVVKQIRAALDAHGADNVKIVMGGIVPSQDHEVLRSIGVQGIFGPGSKPAEIAEAIRACI